MRGSKGLPELCRRRSRGGAEQSVKRDRRRRERGGEEKLKVTCADLYGPNLNFSKLQNDPPKLHVNYH